MKLFITGLSSLLFLYTNSQITVYNTVPSVTIDARQAMYYNIDNPVIISTGTEKSVKITVKNGSIRKGKKSGKYFIRHERTVEYNRFITVTIKTNKRTDDYEFFLLPLPYAPKLELEGYYRNGVNALKRTTGLIAYMKDFTFPVDFTVDSFSVTFKDSVSSFTHINNGAKWDVDSRNYIDNAKAKSFIIINGAWLKGTSDTFYVKEELLYYLHPAQYY